ncbi:glutathione S-transferase [Irpex rosettiformis]|uniref:Glutathione S-transferase n=1 Tax=Irpex rosettiformis TaxID=378272 RepID=A0ACB8U9C3_9APHY|nr:glutathione S-transferase [Irpex rosettiformis]
MSSINQSSTSCYPPQAFLYFIDSMSGAQFTLFSHKGGPNGWKVAIVLEELGLTYDTKFLDFQSGEHKAEPHTKYNPNGRIPTLIDHKNGDFVLWESNAIITYLVDTYDKEHKISAADTKDKYLQLQWLFFQASGQGPYFGQFMWFNRMHPEKIPSAIERYANETKRVLGVLEAVLSKQEWLVGNKFSVADISFIPWNDIAIEYILGESFDFAKEYPSVAAWHAKLGERATVKKIRADKKVAMAA